ncbi:MAG: hypothetical protein ACQEUT_18330 [Bacillota bacterium]
MLRSLEPVLFSFCTFSFLHLSFSFVFEDTYTLNLGTFVLLASVAFIVGINLNKEIYNFFQSKAEWKPANKVERVQNEGFVFIGKFTLYYLFQMCLMVLFFPSFESGNYHLAFVITSTLLYILFRFTSKSALL